MKPRIGPIMKKALDFIRECNGWQTFDQRPHTRKPIERLQTIGLVEIIGDQFRETTGVKPDIAHTLDNDDAVRPQSRTGTER